MRNYEYPPSPAPRSFPVINTDDANIYLLNGALAFLYLIVVAFAVVLALVRSLSVWSIAVTVFWLVRCHLRPCLNYYHHLMPYLLSLSLFVCRLHPIWKKFGMRENVVFFF